MMPSSLSRTILCSEQNDPIIIINRQLHPHPYLIPSPQDQNYTYVLLILLNDENVGLRPTMTSRKFQVSDGWDSFSS